jgi:predicted RNA binding protein with dsRBD fold (UPF0201 family)
MDEIDVEIKADINPTENEAKVKRAIENIFSNVEFEVKPLKRGGQLIARTKGTDGLTKLNNLLRRERIRDAARALLHAGASAQTIVFYLNKQVAYAGHISFSQPFGESPLGPINVEIRCGNPRELIDWLAPKTI